MFDKPTAYGIVLVLLLGTSSLGGQTAPPPSPLASIYATAVHEAAFPVDSSLADNLVAVASSNPNVVWSPDRSKVLVVSWKSESSFKKYYEKQKKTANSEDNVTWVTVVPEVRNFCADFYSRSPETTALGLRLKQYLGLDPAWQYDVFVEMWVKPKDLFRPCLDPEVTDSLCSLNPPARTPSVHHIKNYDQFYRNLYYKSFRSDSAAPWTGLGYTYDWGNPSSKKGASEFILVPKARYEIKRVVKTVDYCSKVD